MKRFGIITKAFLILAMLTACLNGYSQRRNTPPQGRERIEVAKTTFLSRQMKLTPDEARLFWPVYDQYQQKLNELEEERRQAMDKTARGLHGMSDKEINELIDARIQNAELALLARKKLIADLREILPPAKIVIFFRAEQQFNREIQLRINERRDAGSHQRVE